MTFVVVRRLQYLSLGNQEDGGILPLVALNFICVRYIQRDCISHNQELSKLSCGNC